MDNETQPDIIPTGDPIDPQTAPALRPVDQKPPGKDDAHDDMADTPPAAPLDLSQAADGAAAAQDAAGPVAPAVEPPPAPDAPPARPAAARPAAADDPAPDAVAASVPLARLQGVQRQLAQAQKDLTSTRAETTALRTEAAALRENLTSSEKRAAAEYAERLRATERGIVPLIIRGDTIDQVDQSLATSKAAFAAAQQAYARQLPTPSLDRVGTSAPPAADHDMTPLQLLRAGLAKTNNDINQ